MHPTLFTLFVDADPTLFTLLADENPIISVVFHDIVVYVDGDIFTAYKFQYFPFSLILNTRHIVNRTPTKHEKIFETDY